MVVMRESWTDDRLDDLREDMNRGSDRVRAEIGDARAETNSLRGEMNSRFNAIESRFDSMQRTMVIGCVTIVGSVVAASFGAALI
jgi:hypothetical protein